MAFEKLRHQKGSPGALELYKNFQALDIGQQNDANGVPIFATMGVIKHIVSLQAVQIPEEQLALLVKILGSMDDVIDWTIEGNRSFLKELHIRKGKPGNIPLYRLYKKLPIQAQLNVNNKPTFVSSTIIENILSAKLDKVNRSQLQILTVILNAMENCIDWKNPANRFALNALLLQKGNPGGQTLFKKFQQLPAAMRLNADAKPIFISAKVIELIICGKSEKLAETQLAVLMTLLKDMENVIDWTNSDNRCTLGALRKKKGLPGSQTLFKHYSILPIVDRCSDDEKPILSERIIEKIIAAKVTQITEEQHSLLLKLLNEIDDVIDWTNAENRSMIEWLWLKKGRPTGAALFRDFLKLPHAERMDRNGDLFASEKILRSIVIGQTKNVTIKQVRIVNALLDALPDAAASDS
jgi:hypothetical protein